MLCTLSWTLRCSAHKKILCEAWCLKYDQYEPTAFHNCVFCVCGGTMRVWSLLIHWKKNRGNVSRTELARKHEDKKKSFLAAVVTRVCVSWEVTGRTHWQQHGREDSHHVSLSAATERCSSAYENPQTHLWSSSQESSSGFSSFLTTGMSCDGRRVMWRQTCHVTRWLVWRSSRRPRFAYPLIMSLPHWLSITEASVSHVLLLFNKVDVSIDFRSCSDVDYWSAACSADRRSMELKLVVELIQLVNQWKPLPSTNNMQEKNWGRGESQNTPAVWMMSRSEAAVW